jgi:hypothetical protein
VNHPSGFDAAAKEKEFKLDAILPDRQMTRKSSPHLKLRSQPIRKGPVYPKSESCRLEAATSTKYQDFL